MKSSRIMKIFEQYVRKYDMNNINIKARYFHSLKVMEIAKDLATELGIFTDEEIAVCELIGLFHEIGNFSSTPNYHIDEDNEDSSNKAIEVLFNKGLIREISKDKTYDNVIKLALYSYDKIIQAKNYWSGDKTNLIPEYLFVGKAKVLEVTDINE